MPPRKRKTSTAGEQLVAAIVAEMAEDGLEPDARELALLATAARLADRIETLEAIVESEGLMVTSPNGVVKTHPAAVESRACSVALPRVLGGIATTDSSGKNPAKVKAAQTRWRAHNQAKSDRAVRDRRGA